MNARLHVKVKGRVQGVFFRAGARDTAIQLQLKGWVKNNSDGSVEAVAEGDKQHLETFLEWCQNGPQGASVSEVSSEWKDYKGEFNAFSIRYF
ncbi:acylphosphatase [Candidatus Micrarchaeota archaeon]|nr:acylphosphatase [Candidatus Micrarchaeota archaeon]